MSRNRDRDRYTDSDDASGGAGATARFTDRVEFDDSTQRWLQQISKTVSIDGQPIGAITVGIDVAFMK